MRIEDNKLILHRGDIEEIKTKYEEETTFLNLEEVINAQRFIHGLDGRWINEVGFEGEVPNDLKDYCIAIKRAIKENSSKK